MLGRRGLNWYLPFVGQGFLYKPPTAFFYSFNEFLFISILLACMCALHVCLLPVGRAGDVSFPGTEVRYVCNLFCGY